MGLFIMLTGINHITLSVTDLNKSWNFYINVLGGKPLCKWHKGVYLEIGGVWLCLNLKPEFKANQFPDYTHIAWNINNDDFATMSSKIITSGAIIFQKNESEGNSLYFHDPDGHKLEIHTGTWQSRIMNKKQNLGSWQNVEFFV